MLAVLTSPRIGWLTTTGPAPADFSRPTGRLEPARGEIPANDRQTDSDSYSESESKWAAGNIGSNSDSNSDFGSDSDSGSAPPPPPKTPIPFNNPRAVPGELEAKTREVQKEIDRLRADRSLCEVVGHMAVAPISTALREPGVSLEHLLLVVQFEFAKYDAAADPSKIVSYLTPRNLFNPRYLTDAIDRALRYSAAPEKWDFAAPGSASAEDLAAELANFNKKYS